MSSRENPPPPNREEAPTENPSPANLTPALAPGDYYFDGPYLVFTAAYHLKRGACCHSGCRHCPYRESRAPSDPAPASNLEP